MPHDISASDQTDLEKEVTFLAYCWKITRTDAVTYFYTSHDADLPIDGDIYKSGFSFSPGDLISTSRVDLVDDFELLGILQPDEITAALLRDGWFDGAEVIITLVNYLKPENGMVLTLRKGWIGEVTLINEDEYQVNISGLSDKLQVPTGELYGIPCRADLGRVPDDLSQGVFRCGVDLDPNFWVLNTAYDARPTRLDEDLNTILVGDALIGDVVKPTVETDFWFLCTVAGTTGGSEPTWPVALDDTVVDSTVTWTAVTALHRTGTVTSVTDNANFADTSRTEVDDYWNIGHIEWTSGENNGLKEGTTDYTLSGGLIELFKNMRGEIQVGDTYKIYLGCDKSLVRCQFFGNLFNQRSEALLPLGDSIAESGGTG